jgi:exodeoxyribonuclease VII small subunit
MEEGKELSFEEGLKRLEEIVAELEKGNLGLKEALERFDEGKALSRSLEKILREAELRVLQVQEAEGEIVLEDFRESGGAP